MPVGEWFRGPLKDFVADALQSARARQRGYFKPRFVDRLVAEHLSGRRDHTSRLWPLLMFELWHRRYLDGSPHAWEARRIVPFPPSALLFRKRTKPWTDAPLASASACTVVVAPRLLSMAGCCEVDRIRLSFC